MLDKLMQFFTASSDVFILKENDGNLYPPALSIHMSAALHLHTHTNKPYEPHFYLLGPGIHSGSPDVIIPVP